jgi:hypothetical protein
MAARQTNDGSASNPTLLVSSWSLSLLLHGALLALLGTVSWVTLSEPVREFTVGIVVRAPEIESKVAPSRDAAPTSPAPLSPASSFLPPQPDPTESMPPSVTPPLDLSFLGLKGPAASGEAPRLIPAPTHFGSGTVGQAPVEFFSARAWGAKFVFVIDRSGSMAANDAIGAAREELLRALESLPPHTQFQVVFYNTEARALSLGGGRLVYATEQHKASARREILAVAAAGGTQHLPALELALVKLKADTVFFLTDADDMSPRDVERVTQMNSQKATIHAIEFGLGPALDQNAALIELARRNGGTYRYIDTTTFMRPRTSSSAQP